MPFQPLCTALLSGCTRLHSTALRLHCTGCERTFNWGYVWNAKGKSKSSFLVTSVSRSFMVLMNMWKIGFSAVGRCKERKGLCGYTPLTERSHGFCRSSFAGPTEFIGMWGYKSSVPAWALKEFQCFPLLIFHSDNKIALWLFYFKNVVYTKISGFPTSLRSSCYLHHTMAVMRPLQLCCS